MSEQREQMLSLNPETFTIGGGLIDDMDVVLKACRFTSDWDYQGKGNKAFGLIAKMEDDEGGEYEQFYSGGDPKKYIAVNEGRGAQCVGTTGLRGDSNLGQFLTSLVQSGFPASALKDDITIFDGIRVHVKREVQKERPGLKKRDESKGPATILLVTQILTELNDDGTPKAKGKGGKSTGKTTTAAPAAAASDGVAPEVVAAMLKLIQDAGGTLERKASVAAVTKGVKGPERGALIKLCTDKKRASEASNESWIYDEEADSFIAVA